jgi:hypothetical protein
MNEIMGKFAKYLSDNLTFDVVVEDTEDLLTRNEYVLLEWFSRTHDEAVGSETHVFKAHVQAYSKSSNPYAHIKMAEEILAILPHKILLGSDVVDVDKIVNYMELDGARKADILVTLTSRKE